MIPQARLLRRKGPLVGAAVAAPLFVVSVFACGTVTPPSPLDGGREAGVDASRLVDASGPLTADGSAGCAPGESRVCTCPGNAAEGTERCRDDGTGHDPCAPCP